MSLTVILNDAVHLGTRASADSTRDTLRHVPGSVVRGAFAAAWIARYGPALPGSARRDEFVSLFEGGVRFGPLFAPGRGPALSVREHKYGGDPKLCDDVEIDLAQGSSQPVGQEPPPCPQCGSSWEPRKSGTWAVDVATKTHVHVGAEDTHVDGGLHSRRSLRPGKGGHATALTGHLVGPPSLLEALEGLGGLRLGGRRSVQGSVSVRFDSVPPPLPPRAAWDDQHVIVLRLRSPGVFVDVHGRPTDAPSEQELAEVLGSDVEVLPVRYVRREVVGGWHAASGLPKPAESAVAAGSTFLVRASSVIDDSALRRLADRGVGLRRHEGFGDLDGPFPLVPGKHAEDAESARQDGLASRLAPLRGLEYGSGRERWVRALRAVASGVPSAAQAAAWAAERAAAAEATRAAWAQFQALGRDDQLAVLRRWELA